MSKVTSYVMLLGTLLYFLIITVLFNWAQGVCVVDSCLVLAVDAAAICERYEVSRGQ